MITNDRINDFITLDKNDVISLFRPFDPSVKILDFSLMKEGMSNTGYVVSSDSGKYLLKLYSNATDRIETAAYKYLEDKINVPKLYYCGGNSNQFPFVYTITEFIEGMTLVNHIRTLSDYPPGTAYETGRLCAAIHKRKYLHPALLDEKLDPTNELPRTRDKILHLLIGKPAEYLKSGTVYKLRIFIDKNPDLFDRIDTESVLCHGDFGYSNIMISEKKIYIIDFEFAYSGSRYNDIGHFFRRKSDDVQALIDGQIYNAFAQGYNSLSETPLPSDWLTLARICDIIAMLCLLTYNSVPAEWIEDIEYDILSVINQ